MRNQTPKKRKLLRGAAAALALWMALGSTACGKKKAPAALRVDLSGRVNTLDPQYWTTTPERCLIKNCMEGRRGLLFAAGGKAQHLSLIHI